MTLRGLLSLVALLCGLAACRRAPGVKTDQIEPAGSAAVEAAPAAAPKPLEPGSAAPDGPLVAADGHAFRLSDYRGQTVAVTFIFTRCPMPDYCPLLSARFLEVQRLLPANGAWRLLSVTIDPEYDNPERLTAYAAGYHADPNRWTFATGEPVEIFRLATAFGLSASRAGGGLDHTLRTAVLDPQGRVQRIFSGNQWTAEELAAAMREASAR